MDSLTSMGLNSCLKPLSIELRNGTVGLTQQGHTPAKLYVGCDRLGFPEPWDLTNILPSHKLVLSAAVCHSRSQEIVSSSMTPGAL